LLSFDRRGGLERVRDDRDVVLRVRAGLLLRGLVTIRVDQVREALSEPPASTTVAARTGRLFA
jgi:hypothetical protein